MTMTQGRKKNSRISGIDRSLQIMDALVKKNNPMSAYELSKETGAPVSTIYRLVDELVEREMLSKRSNGQIWLGMRLMRYGLIYRASINVFSAAKREMHELCKRTGETVQICTRDEDMMNVIAMAEGPGHFRVSSDVGTRVPLNWTASGRLLLGHLPEEERYAQFKAIARPSTTGFAETDPKILAKESGKDYRSRLAVQMNASEYSVACIAAPIRQADGKCIATISLVLPETRARKLLDKYAQKVQESAYKIEASIGTHHEITL